MSDDLSTELQIAFALRVSQIEALHLDQALSAAVREVPLPTIDAELIEVAGPERVQELASVGIRGERWFATPSLLAVNPRLLGYYRLLLGVSQKEFFRGPRSTFKSMEVRGVCSDAAKSRLAELSREMAHASWTLFSNIEGGSIVSIRDLQLLTLGAQLRGARLNEIGRAANDMVFRRIRGALPDEAIIAEGPSMIHVRNAAGRVVRIAFAADPDIAITEEFGSSEVPKVAIEIKGGTDVSNIHNRLGEAEKSHLKAKQLGFVEFWTIINAPLDGLVATRESPTTQQFFQLAEIIRDDGSSWELFRNRLASATGMPFG
ncbi:MAG: XcyI family restriction endonuclease [Dehalococcoidia bacterium]